MRTMPADLRTIFSITSFAAWAAILRSLRRTSTPGPSNWPTCAMELQGSSPASATIESPCTTYSKRSKAQSTEPDQHEDHHCGRTSRRKKRRENPDHRTQRRRQNKLIAYHPARLAGEDPVYR